MICKGLIPRNLIKEKKLKEKKKEKKGWGVKKKEKEKGKIKRQVSTWVCAPLVQNGLLLNCPPTLCCYV